jgi:hypothetical protein
METKDHTTIEGTGTSRRPSLKKLVEDNLVVFFLSTLLMGFGAGYGAYGKIVEATGQKLVVEGSCIPKRELVGTGSILRTEAVREIDYLIDTGQSLGNDEDQMRVWLMQVLAFIHTLKLEKDYQWQENPQAPVLEVPAVEADIRYAFLDPSIEIQAQKVLGVLKGFRAGLEAQVAYP